MSQELIKVEGKREPRYSRPITTTTNAYMEKPGSVLWYNPVTKILHKGDIIQNEPPLTPDWDNFKNMPAVVDVDAHKRGIESEKKGEIAAGEAVYGGITNEFYGPIAEFIQNTKTHGFKKARELQAGVFSRADFPDIVAVVQSIKMMIIGSLFTS